MTSLKTKAVAGLALASFLAATATPAEARWRHRRHNDVGLAIGAGIVGLGIGAAIASGPGRYGYYNRGYYDDRYYRRGYDRGYYAPRHRYRHRCVTRWQWDPWYGDYVRVRYC